MFRLIPRFLVIFSILFIACNGFGPVQQPKDIEAAKQKWKSSGYSDYSMEVDRSCFCAPPFRFMAVIENNKVVQVIDKKTGEKIDIQPSVSRRPTGLCLTWKQPPPPQTREAPPFC